MNNIHKYEPPIRLIITILFGIYLSTIQFTTSYTFNHFLPIPTPAVLTLGIGLSFFVYVVLFKNYRNSSFDIDKTFTYFIFIFGISIFLSVISSLITLNTIQSVEYFDNVKKSMITRVIYYIAFMAAAYFGYRTLSRLNHKWIVNTVRVYPLSILLLVFFGIWQLLYFIYGVPFLNVDTRSYVHSVNGEISFDFRLTSFADEPSYLGPLIIDMLILGFLAFKKKWVYVLIMAVPALAILLFSFSVSGYFNLALVSGFLLLLFMFHPKFPKKYIFLFLGISLLAVIIFILIKPDLLLRFFSPILGRLDNLFNPQASSRMYMYVMPIVWLFDHSLISALFGYGPGSFDFLSHSKILPNGGSVSTSSNNMYIDLLFEHGIIGFLMIFSVFVYIFISLLRKWRKNIYYLIALLEYVHLLITSLYRADFVTPRFWMVMLIIFLLMRVGEEIEKRQAN